ncbi:MAG: orotidine-5'-phosphate decarboxylase [Gammaproteobacteria bacterium]|jgi:orotidine-5'-phosphate decarboxylase|nr:orotidine-5'-phosphate decarboxylase [Gammaproteobacteria bacterium]
MESKVNNSHIIVSLDYAEEKPALELVTQLDPNKCRLKVGKELFTHAGPRFIEKLTDKDFDVFLDLKFHDIPNTVARACSAAADLGVWMLNVHASGGRAMMQSAREAIDKSSHQPLLIAVTILTSLSDQDLIELGITSSVEDQVLRLAELTKSAGLDGIVCSAQEVSRLRMHMGQNFKLITPGIRPAGYASDDQKRVMTPAEAISAGSDYLVIGRPVTQSENPLQALLDIEAEINVPEGG